MFSANKKTVVLCYPVSADDIDKIERAFVDCDVLVSDQDRIAEDIISADIFCGHAKTNIDWDRIVAKDKLKWIQSSAAGLDHCLTPPVIRSNILVSGCSGLFANQVAEQTLALLYSAIRRMPVFYRAQENMDYERKTTDTLHNKNVAILGFGGNGRRIAELLHGVAAEINAVDSHVDFEKPEYVNVLGSDQLFDVLKAADVVIVTLPLTNETENYIGEREFAAMKKGCYFVNVARGRVVDQEQLVIAISSGQVGLAALDVVQPEPLPSDHPLWKLPNTIITPHIGAQAENRVAVSTDLFCLNYPRFCQQQTLINQVDKKLQYPRPENRLRVRKNGSIQLPKKMA